MAELKITADGSHTIYLPELDETYHSVHGAIQEAIHVFIQAGLRHFSERKNLEILEIGLGTGLNAFLTLRESDNLGIEIKYTAIEAFPLPKEMINELNYTKELKVSEEECELFELIHSSNWSEDIALPHNFKLLKIQSKIQEFTSSDKFDLIYFDAFGPRVQPEMWGKDVFTKMHDLLNSDGVLVTYCAKGSVKRTLKEVGFKVESLTGPPKKREMTRAIKC